jgi:hypothetical protein
MPARSMRPSSARGSDRAARRRAALRPFELAVERLLGARRQLRRDLLLGAAQDERAQRAREHRRGLVGGIAPLRRVRARERATRAEQAGIEELEQAPELAEVVLDRRAAQRQAVRPRSSRAAFATRSAFLIACASSRIT